MQSSQGWSQCTGLRYPGRWPPNTCLPYTVARRWHPRGSMLPARTSCIPSAPPRPGTYLEHMASRDPSARPRRGAARGRVEARLGLDALRGAAQVGPIRRRARAKRAEVPRLASNARLLTFAALVLAGLAPVARAFAGAGLDSAGVARCLLGATRWCQESWPCILATSDTAQASEIAPRATGACYSPHAPRIAVVALLACGRGDSGRCSTHVAGRAKGGAKAT
eukprot:scaffold7915_cov62-Phaeocystis_antarctica.AAC.4